MKFNYSYKAFLITSLLVGNLILLLYSTKLSKKEMASEKEHEIQYALEDILVEEKTPVIAPKNVKIETHKAFNESEKFISEIENQQTAFSKTTQEKLAEINKAIERANNNQMALIAAKNTIPENEENSKSSEKNETTEKKSNNRNSTNSYRLVNRTAIYFPNPVYICEGFGKIVLQIEVNNLGEVTSVSLNSNSSTTTNICLIESAMAYAKKSRFTKAANKPLQNGSITYIFPGQQY